MQNNTEHLTREELCKWLHEEMKIKNHLYYYLSFNGLLSKYKSYLQVYSNTIEKIEKADDVMFRIITIADRLVEVVNAKKNKDIKIEYNINPN